MIWSKEIEGSDSPFRPTFSLGKTFQAVSDHVIFSAYSYRARSVRYYDFHEDNPEAGFLDEKIVFPLSLGTIWPLDSRRLRAWKSKSSVLRMSFRSHSTGKISLNE